MGTQPASLLKSKRSDGVIFHVVHIDKPRVQVGDTLIEGQVIAQVGNNGLSQHPHIHIGAYRGVEPLQIRFDQRFIQPLEHAGRITADIAAKDRTQQSADGER